MAINPELLMGVNIGPIGAPKRVPKKYFVMRIRKIGPKTIGYSIGPLSRKRAKEIAAKTKARYGDDYHVWIVVGKEV